VRAFLDHHPDMHAVMVLPGWIFGPGDLGPTSAGQIVLDTARGKLPGLDASIGWPPGAFPCGAGGPEAHDY
jgi:hypothetical protein